MDNVVNGAVDAALVPPLPPVEAQPAEVPADEKVDRRKGSRKTVGADGTVSYGLKADGTPRAKPGRRPKTA